MIIQPQKEIVTSVGLRVGMKGFFRLRTINQFTGHCRVDTGWFANKILDSGRNEMATQADWLSACQVGTNNTAPAAAQTALLGHIAGTTTIQSTLTGQAGSEPYYGWKQRVYRFAAGATGGSNLSEVGVGWGTTGSTLVSRALIIDPILQTPTTVTPLADEILEVTYEMRYYPPLTDVTSPAVTLNGVSYDTITRAAEVTGDRWSDGIGLAIGQYSAANSDWSAYDGNIGTIIQAPSGNRADCDNDDQYNGSYSNNSYAITVKTSCGPTGWNLGAGIRSIRIKTTAGAYQTQFDATSGGATIPKTSSFTMLMDWQLSWSEYV